MIDPSPIANNTLPNLDDSRYPRPLWLHNLRRLLIHWWILPAVALAVYILTALSFHALPSQLSFLLQYWWALLPSLVVLAGIGMLAYFLYQWADGDYWNEQAELDRRSRYPREELPPPPGFKLLSSLRGHEKEIWGLAWSPDGRMLASGSSDGTIRLWDVETGQVLQILTDHKYMITNLAWSLDGRILASGSSDKTIRLWDVETGQVLQILTGHETSVYDVAWSLDGHILASGSSDKTIRLWDVETGQVLQILTGHKGGIVSVCWSLDGRILASGSDDGTIRLWDVETGQVLQILTGHEGGIVSVCWSLDGRTIVSGSHDKTIRLWDVATGRQVGILEKHTSSVCGVAFSIDGRFLASKGGDFTVKIWRTDTLEIITEFPESSYYIHGLAFSPKSATTFAIRAEHDKAIHIWELDLAVLLGEEVASSPRYRNAKVVLVGDSGVGKSGLGLVLAGKPFEKTDSTHGRFVWSFDNQEVEVAEGRNEMREILLWDLAGQPGYRLVHQLHLKEVAVALIIFDSRSETDPFAGVYHWDRALRQAQRIQGSAAPPLKKVLVAARVDRGGVGVSRERVALVMRELGIEGFFETSAKYGRDIAPLIEAIKAGIDWDMLPWVISTDFFERMKAFLIAQKEAERLLSTSDTLYDLFLQFANITANEVAEIGDLRAQFETCIGRIESRDLIRRLSFGNLVLLQPELLDIYASALVNAVRDEPDGLGSIAEQRARQGKFAVPEDQRLKDKKQEELLLIAMVEDLLYHEIALREYADDGTYLVFPSQSTRENPDLPDPEGKEVAFSFEGPVQNIYATLTVRLSHSGLFQKVALWKNAATYTTKMGGTFGLYLHNMGEGKAELILFFDQQAREEARFHFEEYIAAHLQRNALPESVQRQHIFICPQCHTPFNDLQVSRRRERNFTTIKCSVCDAESSILNRKERLISEPSSLVSQMDRAADERRDRETAVSTIEGKRATNDFDVFLCHNGEDKLAVKKMGEILKERGILPWLDEWELRPGLLWQDALELQIKQIKTVAVFVGQNGRGPWQDMELKAFLRQFVKRQCPVIPVILDDCEQAPDLPPFLEGMTWVDFRLSDPDPLERLLWGITGKHSPIM